MSSRLARPASIWIDPEPIPVDFPLSSLSSHPIVARLLYRRGIRNGKAAEAFLDRRPQPAPDLSALPNLAEATARTAQALDSGEGIGIFGDYDVDGMTAAALLTLALGAANRRSRVSTYLPDRSKGYGLSTDGIDELVAQGASLLIAVDCGSNDHEQVAYAQGCGLDVIILDHHRISGNTPEGAITVSPQLLEKSPLHDLTGVGVAYMLISSLAQEGYAVAEDDDGSETAFLDLVALGTVADVAPLQGINRSLVRDGLAVLASTSRPGLSALMVSAKVTPRAVTATDISFSLAPRLNAAGRMGSPRLALDLLLTDDPGEASALAQQLEAVNMRRRAKTEEVIVEAYAKIAALPNWQSRPLFALEHPTWPGGLLGSVASRLQEDLRRPILLFRNENGILHGSARSVPGFDLVNALTTVEDLLIRYGGHSQAAGITLRYEDLDHLCDALGEQIADQGLEIPVPPLLEIDEDLGEQDLAPVLVRDLQALEPFGAANASPLFRIPGARLDRYTTMGRDKSHLRLTLEVGNRQFMAVQWGAAHRSRELVGVRTIDAVGSFEINTWNGKESLQMMLKDFRIA